MSSNSKCPPKRCPLQIDVKEVLPWQWRTPDLSLCAREWPEVLWLEVEGWQGAAWPCARCYGSTPASLRRTCASPAAATYQKTYISYDKQSQTFLQPCSHVSSAFALSSNVKNGFFEKEWTLSSRLFSHISCLLLVAKLKITNYYSLQINQFNNRSKKPLDDKNWLLWRTYPWFCRFG